jgi:pyruvate dehydrogenase E2 component (dihydrolipoamide acetyltransferase)
MPIELKMPALSPTMEEGTLAKWLVKEGDSVSSGDILAEIETDKATMEFEAVDEGTIAKILVPEGTDEVKVGTVIALIAEEGEDASSVKAPVAAKEAAAPASAPAPAAATPTPAAPAPAAAPQPCGDAARRRAMAATGSRQPARPAAAGRGAWTQPEWPARARAGGSSRAISRRRPARAPARVETGRLPLPETARPSRREPWSTQIRTKSSTNMRRRRPPPHRGQADVAST